MNELIDTERVYVEELQSIIEGYSAEIDNPEFVNLLPIALQNKKEVLFGNLGEIYEFHKSTFLKELENCTENPELVGTCFLKRKEDLQIYEKYCQNKPRSEALWRQCGDSQFFQECQRKLDHKLSLDAYLLKPVQRITKYQLMLKDMLKCSKNSEGTAELEEALASMLDIIKSVNDSMHQIAITGFEGNLNDLGKLLMQGSFSVWTEHKKGHSKVKDLARFKPMQRHLFLYNKMLLFCKKREETVDGHEKTPSYGFKHSLKMSAVGITENVKGDSKKFEVWYNGREEVYIIQGNLNDLGKLLMQGSFSVWTEHKKGHSKVKDLARFKPMQRHLFLYNKMLLFCKKREETVDGHEKTPSYGFKHSLKMSAVGITENVKGDSKKFEVWYNGREEVYIIQASSMDVKNLWVTEIRKVLTGQLEACRGTPIITESNVTCCFEASSMDVKNLWVTEIRKVLTGQLEACREASQLHQRITENVYHAAMNYPNARNMKKSSCKQESNKSESSSPETVNKRSSPASPNTRQKRNTLRDAVPAESKRSSTISTNSAVTRSTSQTGWTNRQIPSLDTCEDFEAIPSSPEEVSNSSEAEEEPNNKNDRGLFRVQVTYDAKTSEELSLESGDLVQLLEEGENGQW
ncbi:UNVERIFIED_CONTAM: hypothetical protein FKN15_023494 [Acipenser sinensis]